MTEWTMASACMILGCFGRNTGLGFCLRVLGVLGPSQRSPRSP